MKMNMKKKKIIIKGIMIFIGVFLLIFILGQMFLNPLLKKVYLLGYEKGKNESCNLGFKPVEVPRTHEDMTKNVPDSVNFTLNFT